MCYQFALRKMMAGVSLVSGCATFDQAFLNPSTAVFLSGRDSISIEQVLSA